MAELSREQAEQFVAMKQRVAVAIEKAGLEATPEVVGAVYGILAEELGRVPAEAPALSPDASARSRIEHGYAVSAAGDPLQRAIEELGRQLAMAGKFHRSTTDRGDGDLSPTELAAIGYAASQAAGP